MEQYLQKKMAALVLCFLLVSLSAWAQSGKTINGMVVDQATQQPIPGATVLEKGTSNGTATDLDGNYTLELTTENAVLQVSFIGYTTQEIEVGNASEINVELSEDISQLDEVVVVGYGTQKRSDITGSVASVPKERLTNLPVTDVTQAIQGTTAGLNVSQTSSVPGSSANMQIRGVNSINANTSPFIVVDGVPFFGSINDLNPNDIESIEILKDASAVAIYGTRGANGVILITTKRGSATAGEPVIKYSGYTGFENMAHVLEPMGPDRYVQKYADFVSANDLPMTDVLPNASEVQNYNAGITTDWLDQADQQGRINEHNLSITGGTENVQYYVSGSRLKQKGVVRGYQFQRTSIRSNLDANITDFLRVGTSAFFSDNNSDGGRVNLLEATAMSPYSVPFDDQGNYITFPMAPEELFRNPLLGLTVDRVDRDKTLSGSGYAEITPSFIPGLKYRLNGTYVYNIDRTAQYTGRAANDQSGTANVSNTERSNWVLENIISYAKDIDKHHIDITGLYSAQEVTYFNNSAQSRGFINDALSYYNMSAGTTQSTDSEGNSYTLLSQMGRINYSYDSRYLLTVTGRRDGYSAFGADTDKYGFFPSMAIGWNIHNEEFMKNHPSVGELKLRLSHGQAGNQAIGVNQTASTAATVLQPFGGAALVGVIYNSLGNANLNWETTTSTNLALDFGVVNNRVRGTVEVYKTKTKDILLRRNLPTVTGYGSVLTNLGEMQNKGIEFTINTVNIENKDFSWETSLNFSTYKNEILELYGDGQDDVGNRWFIGEPLRVIYDYEKLGIWQEGEDASDTDPLANPGDIKFRDQNNDGQITDADRVIVGQVDPKWIGGLTNTFRYKNWNLSVFIQTSQGGMKNNNNLTYADEAGRRNLPAEFNYWTPENPSNYWPSLAAFRNYRGYGFAEDYSYVRIKDARLSYVVPAYMLEKYHIKGLTVYAAGRNLHTFTDWFGWDPENNYSPRGSGDWTNNYPLVRSISFGINLTL
ncbi:TonB-dependent receptor [Echinicola jeungdonensis]|uniref:SusC/RagA family TonB-linked outer membrane protein n=1 Tax=Echinicola jeungdonensis TaxID=709343 RepID=A0ABV5J3T6_9BACT|nr:TonB-dependent receptor [Echinicola jeungdonensis]MDN3668490.1 TonB-dependent receptor [Echinicola jeungdonensis]